MGYIQTYADKMKAQNNKVIKVCGKCDYVEVHKESEETCPECKHLSLMFWDKTENFKTFIKNHPEKAEDFRILNVHIQKLYDEAIAEMQAERLAEMVEKVGQAI